MIYELGTVTQQHEAENGHGTKILMVQMVVWQLIYSAHLHACKQSWQPFLFSSSAVLVALIYMDGGCYSWPPSKNQFFIVDEER